MDSKKIAAYRFSARWCPLLGRHCCPCLSSQTASSLSCTAATHTAGYQHQVRVTNATLHFEELVPCWDALALLWTPITVVMT